jgi:uncharacterized protein YoxC
VKGCLNWLKLIIDKLIKLTALQQIFKLVKDMPPLLNHINYSNKKKIGFVHHRSLSKADESNINSVNYVSIATHILSKNDDSINPVPKTNEHGKSNKKSTMFLYQSLDLECLET